MNLEIWLVLMPNGNRPYTRAMPPDAKLYVKWKTEGARIFKFTGHAPDVQSQIMDPLMIGGKLGYPANLEEV